MAIVLPPSKVNPRNIYYIWQRLNSVRSRIALELVKFKVHDLICITKEKVMFAKDTETTYSTDIFKILKIIQLMPQPLYELTDMQARPIEGQFYNNELVNITVSPETEFQIDKLVRTRNNGGIKQQSLPMERI
jgi:hypothetical protein